MKCFPAVLVFLLLITALPTEAAFVKIKTLNDPAHNLTPPNPVTVAGKVTSVSPLKISDGGGEITVNGTTAGLGDFLVATGNWSGSSLTQTTVKDYIGPASTEMIYIPAGSFLMGNSEVGDDVVYINCDELPQHSVSLSGYYIGKYLVTRGEYTKFINAGGYSNPVYWSSDGWLWRTGHNRTQPNCWAASQDWGSGAFTQTDSHPVVGVTYYESEAYCAWAGGRLPTEAEWEKAARWTGSHPNIYPWGDTWDVEKCNTYYDHNAAGGGYRKYQTSPVGSYPSGASPYGCQDMVGNVEEWCQDWSKSYTGSTCVYDYTNIYRVLRGYSSYSGNSFLRCAYRYVRFSPDYASYNYTCTGFRLAR